MEIPILPMISGRIYLSLLLSNPLLTVSSTSPYHTLYIAANCTEGIIIPQCKLVGQYVSTIWQLSLPKQWSHILTRDGKGRHLQTCTKKASILTCTIDFRFIGSTEFFKIQISQYIFLWPVLALCQKVNIIRHVFAGIHIYEMQCSISVVICDQESYCCVKTDSWHSFVLNIHHCLYLYYQK